MGGRIKDAPFTKLTAAAPAKEELFKDKANYGRDGTSLVVIATHSQS
jgi:hypothetical protein